MTIEATVDGTVIEWRDTKRHLWLIGAIVPLIPVAMWGLYAWTGSSLSWYFGPFFLFVIVPIADIIAGIDPN
ncbi:MAG: alkane 1-monooxygenase, partial [Aeromicrobium sp.]|nr:alkane 1-monooxygenase [Aeromicrobium sp.]